MPVTALVQRDYQPRPAREVAKLMIRKAPMRSDAFDLLTAEQRARAFRIAGVNKASLIRQAQEIITRGLRDRLSLRDVRLQLMQIFEDAGVDAPSLNHLRTVMRTNMASVESIARARVLKSPAVVRRFPFWMYVTVRDRAVRPDHEALDGLVFRADDPFWDKYMPPWAWGCRCSYIPLSDREVKRRGLDVSSGDELPAEVDPPTKDFNFPRDQLSGVDRVTLSAFTGDLRRSLERQIEAANEIESEAQRRIGGRGNA
jgi:SPP1 gp7 family putative phage head morphogenesis protein